MKDEEHNTTESVNFCSAKRPNNPITMHEKNIIDKVYNESEANMTATDRKIV